MAQLEPDRLMSKPPSPPERHDASGDTGGLTNCGDVLEFRHELDRKEAVEYLLGGSTRHE